MSELINRWHVVVEKADPGGISGTYAAHYVARETEQTRASWRAVPLFACGVSKEIVRPFDRVKDLGEIPMCERCKTEICALVARRAAMMKNAERKP